MTTTAQFKKVTTIKNDKGISAPAMCAWQKSSGNYLALRFEGIFAVFIYDRQGKLYKKISIPTNCTGLEWDADGDLLAVMLETPGLIVLWEAHSGKVQEMETGLKDLSTVIAWSTVGKVLALGTLKGNTMVYNHRKLRKIPIIGKHNKKVICAKWSNDEIIAFGTLEDQISLNTTDGDLIRYLQLRGKPSDLQFGYIKEDQSTSTTSDNTLSCIVGEKTLFLMKYDDPAINSPMELGFQARYGTLGSHHWHGDGYIIVAFQAGFVVLLSSHYKEIGTELVLCELKEDILRHASLNTHRGWLAICCGASTLEIHEAAEPKTTLSITEVADDEGRVRQITRSHWTDDGQLLSVTSTAGDVIIYLTSVPMMGGANFNQLAAMSSLTECSLYSFLSTTAQPGLEFTFGFTAQPSQIVLGPLHLAVIVHSSASLYSTRKELTPHSQTPSVKKEFNSNINDFVLNQTYCAARCGDKAHLHKIDGNGTEKLDVKVFPESNAKGFKISSIALAKETFLYGGESGVVKIFHLEQWTEVMTIDLPTQAPIKLIATDIPGGQGALVDKHNSGYYFDVLRPSESETVYKSIPNFPSRCDGVLFDMESSSRHIFLVFSHNNSKLQLYSGWKDASKGTDIEFVGYFEPFKYNVEYKPICFKKGVVCALTGTGRIERSKSLYQQILGDGVGQDQRLNIIKGLVNLRLFSEAYELCCVNSERSDSATNWEYLAQAALEFGQLEIAAKAQARLGNVGMVISIRRMMDEAEDLNALLGEVAMINGDFDLAEAKYLEAGMRDKALEMRRDLQEWDKAMEMADRFESPLVSEIAREYAAVYEYNQDYSKALSLFQKAKRSFVGGRALGMKHVLSQMMIKSDAHQGAGDTTPMTSLTFTAGDDGEDIESSLRIQSSPNSASGKRQRPPQKGVFTTTASAVSNITSRDAEILLDIDKGLARNLLRQGMESEALDLISHIVVTNNNPSFARECAEILEQEKKYEKAAQLYLESGEEVKAACCFVKLKQFAKAEEILKRKPAPEVSKMMAKSKEAEGNTLDAARAYADAMDFENGIRLYLSLGIPEEAATLARQSDDPQDAVKVALYYLEKGDLNEALMYLIRSECYHDALANAFKYGKTEFYADFVFHHFKGEYPEGFTPGLSQVASDFETKKDYFRAGKCYQYLRMHQKSFNFLLKAAQNRVQANEEEVMVELVHTTVYMADDDMARQLVEFLLGENDGAPKDPFYLHYYYVRAEKYVEASKTALIVSRSYQDTGSFLEARNSVFDSMCWLKSINVKFTKDTIDQFNNCHSYMILRTMLNQTDKNIPARIIARVFDNISRFTKACPGLLLAGVNQCQRAGLKHSARQMAFLLIREYREGIDEKFRPAIEQLVRKTGKVDCIDKPDSQSPCPYCGENVEDFELNCKVCKSFIPMCILTGQHVLKSDMCACPGCSFPLRFSDLKKFQSLVKDCPLCGIAWEGNNNMKRINDIRPYLYDNIVVDL